MSDIEDYGSDFEDDSRSPRQSAENSGHQSPALVAERVLSISQLEDSDSEAEVQPDGASTTLDHRSPPDVPPRPQSRLDKPDSDAEDESPAASARSQQQLSWKEQLVHLRETTTGEISKPMAEWSEDDVASFVSNRLLLPQYVDNFRRNNVDGALLMKLTRASLKSDLDIVSLGHRDRICKGIDTRRIELDRQQHQQQQQQTVQGQTPRPQSARSHMSGLSVTSRFSIGKKAPLVLSPERLKKMTLRLAVAPKHRTAANHATPGKATLAPAAAAPAAPGTPVAAKWETVSSSFFARLEDFEKTKKQFLESQKKERLAAALGMEKNSRNI
eukprot:TRINITY_DN4726_c0_g1_i2.p1 TRINITY_DN4726_c0_g1~~TRINITY_DN4726_c0_g1_i2.p1  ORF type:complete len:346 (+),score=79.59 TRINITY_DN4726_c0_g1_i2:52-1038(+)